MLDYRVKQTEDGRYLLQRTHDLPMVRSIDKQQTWEDICYVENEAEVIEKIMSLRREAIKS